MKVRRLIFKTFFVIYFTHCLAENSFICEEKTNRQRFALNRLLTKYNEQIFFIASFAILYDYGENIHGFFKMSTKIFQKEVHELSKIVTSEKGVMSYHYGRENSSAGMEKVQNFSQNFTCVDKKDLLSLYKSKSLSFRFPISYAPTLFYGCKVQKKGEYLKVEKTILLIANEANGTSYTDEKVIEILLQNHKMIDINYSFITKKRFCMCDDILNFLFCKPTTQEIKKSFVLPIIFTIVFMTPIFAIVFVKIYNETSICNKKLRTQNINAQLQPQLELRTLQIINENSENNDTIST